jgi:uncharacterized coiled-coil DUF342 family protein
MKQVFQGVSADSSYKTEVYHYSVKSLTRKKFAATMMVALIISSIAFNIEAYALTVETDRDDFDPGETVVIIGTANATSEILLSVMFNGTDVYEDNFTSLEDGNYSTTFVLDNDAETGDYNVTVTSGSESDFVVFTVEAAETENETLPEPEESENSTSSTSLTEDEGLGGAIPRARAYLDRLRSMIEALSTEYEDNQEVLDRIIEVEDQVNAAEGYLDDADSEDPNAARYFSAARSLMGRLRGLLTSVFKTHKTARIEKFRDEVEKRIGGIQSKINSLSTRLNNGPEVLTAMNSTKLKLNQVMKSLKAGNGSDAMEYLEAIVNEIYGNIDNLNGTETAVLFKDMYRLEAKIRVLEKQALKMQRKGLDVTEVLDSISLAQSQLGQVTSNVERGNGNKNKEGTGFVGMGGAGGSGNGSGPGDVIKGYLKPKKNGKERPSQSGPKK